MTRDGTVIDEVSLGDDDEIVAWIEGHAPTTVGIDAPLLVPNAEGMRPCERELQRVYGSRGAGAHPANRRLLQRTSGRVRGEDLAARLPDHRDPWAGWSGTLLEVYPHPALVEAFDLDRRLRYKRVPAAERPDRLRDLRAHVERLAGARPPLSGPTVEIPADVGGRAAKAVEDRLDARICAWVALVWDVRGPGGIRLFGDAASGHVAVPTVRIGA